MKKYTHALYLRLQEELQEISLTSENRLEKTQKSYEATEQSLRELKEFILDYDFGGHADEIEFFKVIKPRFLSELIFFTGLFNIETHRPKACRETVIQYLKNILQTLDTFFRQNQLLHTYYKTKSTDMDHLYFVRNASKSSLYPQYSLDFDSRFSTAESHNLSLLIAYERLREALEQDIRSLENGEQPAIDKADPKSSSAWTGPKAALIEVAIAVYHLGYINHGHTPLKQFITDLEAFLHVQLGNVYVVYQNMRMRKKDRTPHLRAAQTALENKMDLDDSRL